MKRLFLKRTNISHFLKTGSLFLLVVGLIASGVLVSMSAETRKMAAGFGGTNTYEACNYGKNNDKAVCLDSEYTVGNCVACINGEKHILDNSECAPALCSAPHIKTCSDGKNTYQEGGTACLSMTECVKCSNGDWTKTDRLNCTGVCGLVPFSDTEEPTLDCNKQIQTRNCTTNHEAVLVCGNDNLWHTYRVCGPGTQCTSTDGENYDCKQIINQGNAGQPCNPRGNTTRCTTDNRAIMRCNSRTRKWEVIEVCPNVPGNWCDTVSGYPMCRGSVG